MAEYNKQLTTIDDVRYHIEDLKEGASQSLAAALNAQLQVIKYVSSPRLVDSSLDLLFENIRKSVRNAQSYEEEQRFREQGELMIHNYVFFIDAKLQYATNKNKEEGRLLLKEAANELAYSVGRNLKYAGVNPAILAGGIVNDIVNKANESGFFSRFLDWWDNRDRIAEERDDFIQTLDRLFEKIERYKELIGQSNLIGGLIDRYASDIIDYRTEEFYVSPPYEPYIGDEERKECEYRFSFSERGCLYVMAMIVTFIYMWYKGYGMYFVGVFGFVELCYFGIAKMKMMALEEKYQQEYREYERALKEYENNELKIYNDAVEREKERLLNLFEYFSIEE